MGILKPSSVLPDTPSKRYSQNTQNLCVSKERYAQVRQNKAKRNIKKVWHHRWKHTKTLLQGKHPKLNRNVTI